MGLYTIIKKIKQKEKEVRILMLGLDNAGKTTIVKYLCNDDIYKISPTFGFNIKTIVYDGYTLNLWDVGGQKSLRSYWQNYFENTDGLIWVIDSSDKGRFNDCKKELDNLLLEERLEGASLLIFANKQDLPNAVSSEQLEDILNLNSIKTHHYKIFPCSTITGENIFEGIKWLISNISSRIFI